MDFLCYDDITVIGGPETITYHSEEFSEKKSVSSDVHKNVMNIDEKGVKLYRRRVRER